MAASSASSSTNQSLNPVIGSKLQSKFFSDIEEMMYGFGFVEGGADWPPDKDAVELVDILAQQYIQDLTMKAVEIADLRGKFDKDCFIFLIRKDRRKLKRVNELLRANEELKKARIISECDIDVVRANAKPDEL